MGDQLSRRQVLAGGMGAAALLAGRPRPGLAQSGVPSCSSTPLVAAVGLGAGQVARLSIVRFVHDRTLPPDPCHIVAAIVGADGVVRAQEELRDLAPNTAAFVDFAPPPDDGRPHVFGAIRFWPADCLLGATLETVDLLTGRTMMGIQPCVVPDPSLGGLAGAPLPPILVPGGTLGFTRSQRIRLSVLRHVHGEAFPPDPVHIVAEIVGADGRLLASESFTRLGPEQGGFVELDHPGGSRLGLASRLQVYGHVRFTPGQLVGGLLAVVNELTGQTMSGIVPCTFPDPALA